MDVRSGRDQHSSPYKVYKKKEKKEVIQCRERERERAGGGDETYSGWWIRIEESAVLVRSNNTTNERLLKNIHPLYDIRRQETKRLGDIVNKRRVGELAEHRLELLHVVANFIDGSSHIDIILQSTVLMKSTLFEETRHFVTRG